MTITWRRIKVLLSATLVVLQALCLPVGMIYAETVEVPINETGEVLGPLEFPRIKNYLEEGESSEPRFFFSQSLMKGAIEESIKVIFFSDQEVSEARVTLPNEAKLLKDQLPAGLTAKQGAHSYEWIIQTVRARSTFVLPVVFDLVGNYEVAAEGTTATIEVQEQEEEIVEEKPAKEPEAADESSDSQEELKVEEGLNDKESSGVSEEQKNESAVEDPKDQPVDEQHAEDESKKAEQAIFDGKTIEVDTFEQLRAAIANSEVAKIEVRANLSRTSTAAATAIGALNRSLVIKGNGYTIDFGGGSTSALDNGSLILSELDTNQEATLKVENAILRKNMPLAIFNARGNGLGWELQLENITEHANNVGTLAYIPQGKVAFTGGMNRSILPNLNVNRNFIEAKETIISGGATVDVTRGNTCVIWSSSTVKDPKIKISEGSRFNIITGTGTVNTIDLSGENPTIELSGGSILNLQTQGTSANPTIGSNNSIMLRGIRPRLVAENDSKIQVQSTNAKRGVVLEGITPTIIVSNSIIDVKTATGAGVALVGNNANLTVTGSQLDVTTVSGQAINLSGNGALFEGNESKVTIQSTTGQRMNLIGSNPILNLKNSRLDINATTGRGIYLQGASPQVLLGESQLVITDTGASQGMILQGTDALLSLSNQSEMAITGAGTGTTENIQIGNNNARPKISVNDGSKLSVKTTSGSSAASNTGNNAVRVEGSTALVEVGNTSKIDVTIESGSKRGFLIRGFENKIKVDGKSEISVSTREANGIEQAGSDTLFEVASNSKVYIDTVVSGHLDSAGFFLGERNETSSGGTIKIHDNSLLDINSQSSSALTLLSKGSEFLIESGSKINLSTESSNDQIATLRFRTFGDYIFQLEHAEMNISKNGGDAPAIRMFGGNNVVNLMEGAKFNVYNKGNGIPHDGNVTSGGNIGINYTSGGGSFNVSGKGAEVRVIAENGPAIDMGNNLGEITTSNGGYFHASARTATATGGVFRAGILNVDFDNPLFMDFRNDRFGGGNLFNVANGSSLKASNSDLAVWKNGSNLDGDPDLNFPTLDFSFSGTNFNNLGATSQPDILNTGTFGTTGLTAYSRLSSNNARWAIADELRVPTNADKKIYGHISIPVGLEESRSAWEGEATVTVEVDRADGRKKDYTAKTVGHSNAESGISIYGEEPRAGLFEVNLEEHLQKGDKVKIKEVHLTSGELTQGYENIILTDIIEVFPIVPPTPATFSSSIIAPNSKSIQGVTDNLNVEVTATHNGEALNTDMVTIGTNGEFTLDLSGVSLERDDEIQVFLRDTEGSAQKAGVINPPETNNANGNINPDKELAFHDVTFEAATTLIVGDTGPIAPMDPLNPEKEVDPENPPTLPEDQGLFSLDFASQFDFDLQAISAQNQTYYAKPQRLLNEDGTVNEDDVRPNYVQISDRRSAQERDGWELSVRQHEQFHTEAGEELTGARLVLQNQQIATAQGGTEPGLQHTNPMTLIPGGAKRTLLKAQGPEGEGTWIYRFGNAETAAQSVALEVPKGATPSADRYKTTLTWELSSVPQN